jgi:site-specific DNA recombinase
MYAESKGWWVREVYHLEVVSGKSVRGSPESERMLEHVRADHISGLVFSNLARLAGKELLEFADGFREHDACNHAVCLTPVNEPGSDSNIRI